MFSFEWGIMMCSMRHDQVQSPNAFHGRPQISFRSKKKGGGGGNSHTQRSLVKFSIASIQSMANFANIINDTT